MPSISHTGSLPTELPIELLTEALELWAMWAADLLMGSGGPPRPLVWGRRSVERGYQVRPRRSVRPVMTAVLYRSDAATVIAYRARASRARQRPSLPWILLETTTWVCRLGSPSR